MNEPFAITAGANDALLFTFGGEGGQQVAVTLTAGAAQDRHAGRGGYSGGVRLRLALRRRAGQ